LALEVPHNRSLRRKVDAKFKSVVVGVKARYVNYLLIYLQSRIYNKEEVDEDEPLYVLITANSDEDLAKGVEMIQGIIEQTDEN